ncbi:MAG TPA: hypothetical protein DCM86_15160, partial [Verrucomicrobiales bacterium]|nr:hypothetical protein [Verrucomicrobiales bacterium]
MPQHPLPRAPGPEAPAPPTRRNVFAEQPVRDPVQPLMRNTFALLLPLLSLGCQILAAAPAHPTPARAPAVEAIGQAVNALGIQLLTQGGTGSAGGNLLLSPYSIQGALGMTYAGADGVTRQEMARVLHYPPGDEATVHRGFAELRESLEALQRQSAARAGEMRRYGQTNDPLTLQVANTLFGESGFPFLRPFLELLHQEYRAPLQQVDFAHDAATARLGINRWVESQTRGRIRDLVPPGGVDANTRLVLVNALHLKAPWMHPFPPEATTRDRFRIPGAAAPIEIPTLFSTSPLGYLHREGLTLVAVPYLGGELQFLILLPDQVDGLAALEARLTPSLLAEGARLSPAEVALHLPKLRMEPPMIRLGASLRSLGMGSAFDQPRGSADFTRMSARAQEEGLHIAEVFHRAVLELDERGTEAAAATAVSMAATSVLLAPPPKPFEVRVDHP